MRVVLDTNILVRAAATELGVAGALLRSLTFGPHVLITSPYIIGELARVLAYPRLQARWGMADKTIREFVGRLIDVAEIVLTATPDRIVWADADDDPIVEAAVVGRADALCTRDAHLLHPVVISYCANRGIRVMDDLELHRILTGPSRTC